VAHLNGWANELNIIRVMKMKKCTGGGSCGNVLGLDKFNKKGKSRDGSCLYRSQCISCWNVWRRRDSKTEHGRSKQKKHNEEFYKKHPEKLKEIEKAKEKSEKRRLKAKTIRLIKVILEDKLGDLDNTLRINNIIKRVKGFGYDILSAFNSIHDYVEVKCKRGHKKKSKLSNILSGQGGCKDCAHEYMVNKINNVVKDQGATLLEPYKNNRTRILYRCKNGHENKRFPKVILNGNACGDCNNGSSCYSHFHGDDDKQNKIGCFYKFNFNLNGRSYKMIGISKIWKSRINQYKSKGITPLDIEIVKMPMMEAFICEQELLNRRELQDIRAAKGLGFSGSTECFDVTDVDLFHPIHSV
jgi:hypothetical protein